VSDDKDERRTETSTCGLIKLNLSFDEVTKLREFYQKDEDMAQIYSCTVSDPEHTKVPKHKPISRNIRRRPNKAGGVR
jgi:hypothetical protein